MGQDEILKANQKKSQLGIPKNCKMEKKLYANPKRKSWKNTNCISVSSHRTLLPVVKDGSQ